MMLKSDKGLMVFVGGMDPLNESLMVDLLKVTAAVCLVTGGHEKIMEAITINGENNACPRFEPIMEALSNTDNPTLMASGMYLWCSTATYISICSLSYVHTYVRIYCIYTVYTMCILVVHMYSIT